MLRSSSVFNDESKLDINYVPSRLPHRASQLNLLNQFFRFAIDNPGKMAQRILITGKIGTGKTVLSQHFGLSLTREAQQRGVNLHYVHVNCRECKGSLFMVLQKVILQFYPNFPRRGYSAEELLQALMHVLDERGAYVLLALDELETLIHTEGSTALYNLTRIQEERLRAPQRLSLLCILRQLELLEKLDPSTRSTLQRNFIRLDEYSPTQLEDILQDRVNLAFQLGTVSPQILGFISELAHAEGGDARYAIELLWRAGKYADASQIREVTPECVRKAAVSIYPAIQQSMVSSLSLHEKLFLLGIARRFQQTGTAYLPMGEAEDAYAVVCEEYDQKKLGHTQLWKYVKSLAVSGVLQTRVSGIGHRGKTTLISLLRVPAADLEKALEKLLPS